MGKIERLARIWSWVAAAASLAAWVGACQSENDADTSGGGVTTPGQSSGGSTSCGPGVVGCACETNGATAACGHVVTRSGDYVTCSEGHSTCDDGVWSACIGDNIVTPGVKVNGYGAIDPERFVAALDQIGLGLVRVGHER